MDKIGMQADEIKATLSTTLHVASRANPYQGAPHNFTVGQRDWIAWYMGCLGTAISETIEANNRRVLEHLQQAGH